MHGLLAGFHPSFTTAALAAAAFLFRELERHQSTLVKARHKRVQLKESVHWSLSPGVTGYRVLLPRQYYTSVVARARVLWPYSYDIV